MTSLSRRRAGARNGARLAEQTIAEAKAHLAEIEAARQEELKARRQAARDAERARPKMTSEDVRGARLVRDQYGWHKVVRVSAKSVTVATGYSWTERIPLAKILEVAF